MSFSAVSLTAWTSLLSSVSESDPMCPLSVLPSATLTHTCSRFCSNFCPPPLTEKVPKGPMDRPKENITIVKSGELKAAQEVKDEL